MAPKRRACLGLPESEDIDGIVIDDSDDGEAADLAAGPSNVNPPAGSQQGSQGKIPVSALPIQIRKETVVTAH